MPCKRRSWVDGENPLAEIKKKDKMKYLLMPMDPDGFDRLEDFLDIRGRVVDKSFMDHGVPNLAVETAQGKWLLFVPVGKGEDIANLIPPEMTVPIAGIL